MDRNFGEELVYWYLRLNGFFIINNFVLHHDTASRTSDADLLAVRFPYVYEDIGGREEDWDATLLSHFPKGSIIGLICEVKTGVNFSHENMDRKQTDRMFFPSSLLQYIIWEENLRENRRRERE